MRCWLGLVTGIAAVVPTAAQAMTVETFLAKAKALQSGGLFSATSPDLALVRSEIRDAAIAYRTRVEADRVAGRPPRSCPPPTGKAKIDAKKLVVAFDSLPPAERSQPVTSAFIATMERLYPCG